MHPKDNSYLILRLRHIIFLSLQIACLITLANARLPYNAWMHYSAEELYAHGQSYKDRQLPDSALACFTMCAMKFDHDGSRKDIATSVKAMRMEAQLYFYDFYDYDDACDKLSRAIQLCKSYRLTEILPMILLEQAGVYMTYANQNPSEERFRHSENLYREAFAKAYAQGDKKSMSIAFSNLVCRFHGQNRLKELSKEFDIFGKTIGVDTSSKFTFSKVLYKGMQAEIAGNRQEARRTFLSVDSSSVKPRHEFELVVSAIRSLLAEENIDSAIILEHRLLRLCQNHDLKDGRAVVLRDLATLYEADGDSAMASKYSIQALQCKDSLINVHHLDRVNAIQFLEEMHQMQDDIKKNARHSVALHMIIAILVIIMIGGSAWWYIAHKRNKRAIAKALEAVANIEKETQTPTTEDVEEAQKYKTSSLDNQTRMVLIERLQKAFNPSNPELYMVGFSIKDVAKNIQSNSRYVSQVVNEHFGCNFSTLLSTIRAKEAARRIANTEEYGAMTFEAIGNSVGFGSRASFNTAFKRVMGMTPREYRVSLAGRADK